MKNLIGGIVVVILLVSLYYKTHEKKDIVTADKKMLILDKEQFKKKLAATPNAQLIDVRTPEEVAEGAIENSVMIDYKAADFDTKIQTLDKDKPVFLYCRSGGRSGRAATKLHELGYKEVYDLKGGYLDWSK